MDNPFEEIAGMGSADDLKKFLKMLKSKIASGEISPENIEVKKMSGDEMPSEIKEALGLGVSHKKGKLTKKIKIPKSLHKMADKAQKVEDDHTELMENIDILKEKATIAVAELWEAVEEKLPETAHNRCSINLTNKTINVYETDVNF